MAQVFVHGKYIVIISLNKCVIYDLKTDKVFSCCIPVSSECPVDKSVLLNGGKVEGSDQILAAGFSSSGKYFAASDDHKQLTIWDVSSGWIPVNTRIVPRRATSLVFSKSGEHILVADKAGDVYRFSVMNNDSATGLEATLVVGHVSMLLDLKLCSSDRFLVTCDRDEKIRVSHYPNAYNIQSFCLGHTDYVRQLIYVEECDLLLSASGDGTVKLWNYIDGKLLDSSDCSVFLLNAKGPDVSVSKDDPASIDDDSTKSALAVRSIASIGRSFAVILESQNDVLLYTITNKDDSFNLSFCHRLSLTSTVSDAVFIDRHHLVVLQTAEGATATAYKFTDLRDVALLTDDTDTDLNLLQTVKRINEDVDVFKSLQSTSSIIPILRKAHIDNMAEYIEKKKQKNKKQVELTSSFVEDDSSSKKQRLDS